MSINVPPPSPQQQSPGSRMRPPQSSGTNPWVVFGVLAGAGCILSIVLCGGGFAFLVYLGTQEPENIEIEIDASETISAGAVFEFTIFVTNTAQESQEVRSIDIDNGYLEGFTVEITDPPYQNKMSVPFDDKMSYEFRHDIPAGETAAFTFSGTATSPGRYFGPVDVCINSDMIFTTLQIRTIVE